MADGRCIFCESTGGLTAEHPMSKRVLDLAGFGLDDVSLEIDVPVSELTVEYIAERTKTIRDEVVRCVCARCNNGWMQDLDHSFAGTIERWADRTVPFVPLLVGAGNSVVAGQAECLYSLMRPSHRVDFTTERGLAGLSTGRGGAGGCWASERCGRWVL